MIWDRRYLKLYLFIILGMTHSIGTIWGQEIDQSGYPIPDLRGLTPYSIQIKQIDGVEKIVEKFYTPEGGHIARISGNGRIFAFVVDHDQEPPIDYLIMDPDGSGRFTKRLQSEDAYQIPEWVSQ